MGTTVQPISPYFGKDISLYTAPLNSDNTFPSTPFTITVDDVAGISAGATSITVDALGGEVRAGTFLTFEDPNTGAQTTVYVTADAAAGATSLSVGDGNSTAYNGVADAGVPKAIADNSTATYPPEIYDATDSSESNSASDVSELTYNSGGATRKFYISNDFSMSIPVAFQYPENAGARTLERAADDLTTMGVLKILPTANGYTNPGKVVYIGNASVSRPSPAAGVIAAEFEFAVSGAPTRIEPSN